MVKDRRRKQRTFDGGPDLLQSHASNVDFTNIGQYDVSIPVHDFLSCGFVLSVVYIKLNDQTISYLKCFL